ncbi:hypothetical protein [Polaromonas sp.]|jgi:hypothetical protein|uniref:hypothetical protein n=1 Tax=Polaromonas sp. TaxID=1869339 RepID=UPI0037CC703C
MTGEISAKPPVSLRRSLPLSIAPTLLLWVALFTGGLLTCSGNSLPYILFSLSALLMLASGVYRQTSYGYLFLVIFLWLGFWLKFTVHTILDIPYGEPIGAFNRLRQSWDDVLFVGTVAHLGVFLGWVFFRFAIGKSTMLAVTNKPVPAWYPAARKWLWVLMLLCLIGLPAANSIYGIMQIGLVPRTLLPWPLNAVVGWMVSMGLAMGIATLVWWELGMSKSSFALVSIILAEAVISTTTLLSRGVFIFHAIPTLLALYKNRPELIRNFRQWSFFILLFALFFGLSFVSVDALRSYFYPDVRYSTTANQIRLTRLEVLQGAIGREEGNKKAGQVVDDVLSKLYAEQKQLEKPAPAQPAVTERIVVAAPPPPPTSMASLSSRAGEVAVRFLQLAIGRWIGLEGVMSVQAYQDKGTDTLLRAAKEKREAGKTTLYQEVSKSHYRWTDPNVWQFASLPGAAAFLYYSGSMWVVLLGMGLFSAVVLVGEYLVFRLTGNPLLCALIGLALANTVAQMGIAPRQDFPYYFMIGCGVLTIGLIQSRLFTLLLEKLRLLKIEVR